MKPDIVEFVESTLGLELTEFQKNLLKTYYEHKDEAKETLYLNIGRSNKKVLMIVAHEICSIFCLSQRRKRMSVDICKTGYCQGCTYADLEVSQEKFLYNHEVHTKDTVSCKHKQACERMEGIMNQQKDYILHNGVRHIPIKSVNDIEMELTNDLVRKAIQKAYDPEVILTIKKGEDDEHKAESEGNG